MYLIQDLNPNGDHWRFSKNNAIVFTGGFKSLLRYAVLELGFDVKDFEKVIGNLIYREHNTMEFDKNKRLVSTSYQNIQRNRKIE